MKRININSILKEISYYFGFLFERGFKIHSVQELSRGDWQIALALDNFVILIYSEQGEINLLFSTTDSNFEYRVGLDGMIHFLSSGQVFIGKFKKSLFRSRKKQIEKLARILIEYIDDIAPYFGEDYERYQHEIKLAQQQALDAYLGKNLPKQ